MHGRGPPPHGYGGGHRGGYRDDDRRRPRSPPPFMHDRERFGGRPRSPPPKRGRRDGPYHYNEGPPYNGRGSPEYDRRATPPRAYEERDMERRGSVAREKPELPEKKGPMTFKEFTLAHVPDDAAPDAAHRMYQEYLVEYYGSAIKAEFEQNKDSDFFKMQFDPRTFAKVVASRAEEAQDSAKHIAADLASAALDPSHENFNQGMYDLAPKIDKDAKPNAADGPKFAPNLCFKASRVAHDLDLSRQLIRKLDAEKGVTENPLLPQLPAAAPAAAAAADAGGGGEKPEKSEGGGGEGAGGDGEGEGAKDKESSAPPGGDAAAAMETDGAAAAAAVPTTPSAAAAAAPAAAEAETVVDDSNYGEMLGKLDLQLHWLWKVHGVDYYAGIELNEQDWQYRTNCCRLIRGPKPEEGEGGDEEADKADAEKLAKQVDETWTKRMASGDPIEAKCMKARIEDELDKWIEGQVTMVADQKWGSKLSTKLFVGRKYVVKHIKTKHQDKLATEREQILDALYFENFRQWKEDEERRRAEEEQQGGEHGEGEAPAEVEPSYGPGRGRGMMRGRGRGMMGRGMMGRGPMMMEAPMMMPMPMAPMFVPSGPMGPIMPIFPGPVPIMPPHGGPMPMRGRGRGPMRGGRGPMPGRGMPPKLDPRGMREYYDLDHPANNRAVLDYGDL